MVSPLRLKQSSLSSHALFRCLRCGLSVLPAMTLLMATFAAGQGRQLQLPQRGNPRPSGDQPALLRNYELSNWRKAAFQLIQDKQTAAGLRQLQKIFDALDDGFEPAGEEGKVIGLKQVVRDWLNQADPAIRNLYEQLYGQQALAVLKEAGESNKLQVYSEVYGRWFHTRAGAEAAYQLMLWHADHGTPELGVRYGESLLRDPWHAAALTDTRRGAVLVTAIKSGESQALQGLATRAEDSSLVIGPDQVTLKQWIQQRTTEPVHVPANWEQPSGSETRNQPREGSPPTANALWRRSLLAGLREDYDLHIRRWWTVKRQQNESSGSGLSPIILGDQLVFRDCRGVHGVHLRTGKELWSYRTSYHLQKVLDILRDDEGRTARDDEYERLFLYNSILGSLSTDGERIYLIDGMVGERKVAAGDPLAEEPGWRPAYRLVALSMSPDSDKPATERVSVAWSAGGAGGGDHGAEELPGHLFLGPPTLAYGKLYAITESQGAMNLIELDAATGKALRIIPYAMQPIPIALELSRANWVCMPSISRGVAVCPTHRGLLVGIDLANDSLMWVHNNSSSASAGMNRYGINRRVDGHEGFLNLPLIQGSLVFDLSRHSRMIECVELLTGEEHWEPIPRGDGEYIGCATKEVLLIVGQQGCRGLDVQTGKELWSTRLGASSGRGVALGDRFLVPLANGQVISLEIKTGLQTGYPAPLAEDRVPGHLLACRDVVVSVTPVDLAVYPQSRVMLEQLTARKEDAFPPGERQLRIGELELRMGDLANARKALETSAKLADQTPNRKEEAERLLRELFCIELSHPGVDSEELLKSLQSISRRPEDRVRYLAFESETAMEKGQLARALAAGRELTTMPTEVTLSLPREPQLQVASRTWGAEQLERLLKQSPAKEARETERLFEEETAQARKKKSVAEWQRLLSLYRRSSRADLVREELARQLLNDGVSQQAELLLLKNRNCGIPAREAEATRLLAELWSLGGFHEEAGECLYQLQTKYAKERLNGGLLGAEFAGNFPKSELATEYARRFVPLEEPVDRVRISVKLGEGKSNQSLNTFYGASALVADPRGSFMLMDREQMRSLAMVDRETGQVVQDFVLPTPISSCRGSIGHLYPIGGQTTACGISLVERKVLWDKLTWKGAGLSGMLQAGPSGSDFTVFQTRQELFLADPCTGAIRWRRNDLDPSDGPYYRNAGVIQGDDQILIVFARDQADYRIFDTLSGRELRRGRLPSGSGGWRCPFGRKLLYRTFENGKSGLQLWDPLTDEVLAKCGIKEPFVHVDETTKEFLYLDPENQLHIVNGPTGKQLLQAKLPTDEPQNVNSLMFFSDPSRYYVMMNRSMPSPRTMTQPVPEMQLSKISIGATGELCAFEKGTGKFLWKRPQLPQTFLLMPQYSLPFLMGMSVSRYSNNATHYSMRMQLEILDCQSGQTIALKKDLPKDQISQMIYERDARTISLRGQQNEWLLDFGPKVNRFEIDDEISRAD